MELKWDERCPALATFWIIGVLIDSDWVTLPKTFEIFNCLVFFFLILSAVLVACFIIAVFFFLLLVSISCFDWSDLLNVSVVQPPESPLLLSSSTHSQKITKQTNKQTTNRTTTKECRKEREAQVGTERAGSSSLP